MPEEDEDVASWRALVAQERAKRRSVEQRLRVSKRRVEELEAELKTENRKRLRAETTSEKRLAALQTELRGEKCQRQLAEEQLEARELDSQRVALRCGICLDDMLEPAFIPCGHMFCFGCIETATQKKCKMMCPICKKKLKTTDDIIKAYLSAS